MRFRHRLVCAVLVAIGVLAAMTRSVAHRARAAAGPPDAAEYVSAPEETRSVEDASEVSATGSEGDAAGTIGPDIIVVRVDQVKSYGHYNGISSFSVGATSCNIGDEAANWNPSTNQHPVIAQNMFRLKDNRFEQIGMSWLKHGFSALIGNVCGTCQNPGSAQLLGVHCSDPYDATLNGLQTRLGPRSPVNSYTGFFTCCPNLGCPDICSPSMFPCPSTTLPQCRLPRRLQVRDSDLDPDQNAGASYFVDVQYVHNQEALAGNGRNSISYRKARFVATTACVHEDDTPFASQNLCAGNTSQSCTSDLDCGVNAPCLTKEYCMREDSSGTVSQPGIRAWKHNDSSVVETEVNIPETETSVPVDGLMILAAKTLDLGNGFWSYEYALQNITSDRSAGSFRVPIPAGAIVGDIGFHDVDYHSGDPFDGTDWTGVEVPGGVSWSTASFAQNPNANALRWGTLYNFRFTANIPPDDTTVVIGLFKPGFPQEVAAATVGPHLGLIDCNGNTVADACDVNCNYPGCEPPCGSSLDCNTNGLPDECEPDCNNNDVPDPCDIGSLYSLDCNGNQVPDECEADCDGDGIPDVCDDFEDADLDTVEDCRDHCPLTTPENGCRCPLDDGECCFLNYEPPQCFGGFPRDACLEAGGLPECFEPCRDGCLVGDADLDGDVDLEDLVWMWMCFSGENNVLICESPPSPTCDCLLRFDLDGDRDVDSTDLARLQRVFTGP